MAVLTQVPKEYIQGHPLVDGSGKPAAIVLRHSLCGPYKPDGDFLVPHRKDYYLYVFVKKGNSRHWVDGTPYVLQNDTFYFTVPQQVHLKEDAQPMEGYALCFNDEFLQLEENRALKQLPIIVNRANGHELQLADADIAFVADVMQKMTAEYNTDNIWRNQMLGSWLRVLVIYMSRLYNQQFEEHELVKEQTVLRTFQGLVGQHYTTVHDVSAYAGMMNISPGYLNSLVKQQSGKTAITHIHERLAVEAKRRLLHTSLSVKEIGDELGFEDAAYFNRFFKRMAEVTPVTYRQQIREVYR